MPGEIINEPNPKPQPSHLPDYLEKLSVKLGHECRELDQNACDSLLKFRRAASYIAAGESPLKTDILASATKFILAMIFLEENTLLKEDLTFDHVKPRLLGKFPSTYRHGFFFNNVLIGHWGTCPGLILVYSHLNYLIRKMNLDMLYVVGPGHGAPALLAALWLEGSLERFYPQYSRNVHGLHNLISNFSTPSGFPRSVYCPT